MFSGMDKDSFMQLMQECHKSYMEMLWERLCESPSLKDLNDEEHSYGKDMELPESAQQPKNVNKMIASAGESSGPKVFLNFYLGGE